MQAMQTQARETAHLPREDANMPRKQKAGSFIRTKREPHTSWRKHIRTLGAEGAAG